MSEHGNMNIDMQQASYGRFTKIFLYGTVFVVILLILMAAFLL
ncbi:MAG: aa3-type cytochrome c oxidase subunit IV [Alphaproteobacteria bacterium]|nr:MAG: aa3-type cytochrome c oxidase subunit IV [Alphaproteobacteria bacterium]